MVVELASARQALEDEHRARAAELEQLRKEGDELHGGLQTAAQERDVAAQERDAAIQQRNATVQEHDAAVATAGQASKREKTALASH